MSSVDVASCPSPASGGDSSFFATVEESFNPGELYLNLENVPVFLARVVHHEEEVKKEREPADTAYERQLTAQIRKAHLAFTAFF